MNSGGVVETSDVCLDCHTVIDKDVDFKPPLALIALEKKICKMLNNYFSPFFFVKFCRCLYMSEVCCREKTLQKDKILHAVFQKALC